ncbi:hypothetical protein [Alkalilacustris brevis]|uniref:hypothetical protein n=1 Tax=Alkalilacustris brevis TaxID=2026338 RepID=UPI000E0D9172|nr:hypothetical protein [Alkalilacustris brevis]
MSIMTCRTGLHRNLQTSDWIVALLSAWLAPVALGAVVILLHLIVSTAAAETAMPLVRMSSYFLATGLIISPAFTWIGLGMALPLLLGLQATGWFGLLPSMAVGATTGALAAWFMGGVGSVVGPAFGVFGCLLFWLALRLRRRDLFNHPATA